MTLDLTIPRNLSVEAENLLLKLITDFQEGYLTEKGYTKKRLEILEQFKQAPELPLSAAIAIQHDIIPVPSRTLETVSTQVSSETRSENLTDDFYIQPDHCDENSNFTPSQPVILDNDVYEFYKTQNQIDTEINKELQKPLDPRDVQSHIHNDGLDNLALILRKRATIYAKNPAVLIIDQKGKESKAITWEKLYFRAEKIAKQIKNKAALYPGDRVCLLYQNFEVIDFIVALFGCFLSSTVAVPINSGLPVKELVKIMTDTQSHLCLMSDSVFKHFEKQNKQTKSSIWPKGMDIWKTSDMGTYNPYTKRQGYPALKVTDLAYIEYSKSSIGQLRGVVVSHRTIIHQMRMISSILSSSPDMAGSTLVHSIVKETRSKNTILSTLDVRESAGLIISVLFSVFSGNLLIWTHQKTTEVAGLYANIISTYKISILLSDYLSLKQVAYNYQSFPQFTRTFNKKVKVDLSTVKWCLINALTVDCEFNDMLSDRWLKPLGHKNPKRVIAPILSLSEHGGAIISMHDWIGNEEHLGCIFHKPLTEEINDESEDLDGGIDDRFSEVLIDKASLTTNSVKIVSDRPPSGSSLYDSNESFKYVRIGAFGYPLPDATLAIVNPETQILSGAMEVGEIWVDSHCISGGYWGLPDDTRDIFQAECSDYEGILNLKFVRTSLLGFTYNGKVYVLGLYEDRINQRVTWYDQYLDLKEEEKNNKGDNRSSSSVPESVKSKASLKIELPKNVSTKFIYKYHYSSHLVKTLARNIPEVTDCSFFNVKVNKEYLPIAVIESASAKPTNGSVSKVDVNDIAGQAFRFLEQFHNVRVFCLLITAPDSLSRTLRSGRLEVANTLSKKKFLEGRLPSVFVRFNVVNSLGTIYHGEDPEGGIWSKYSSRIRKEMLSYAEFQYSGLDLRDFCTDDRTNIKLTDYKTPYDLLHVRASKQSDELAFCSIEGAILKEQRPSTWKKFEAKVFSICSYILEKKLLKAGDYVVLMYSHCEEYIVCLYACWMAGFIVIPIPPIDPDAKLLEEDVNSFVSIVREFNAKAIFVNNEVEHSLKNKPISAKIKQATSKINLSLPKYRNTTKHAKETSSGKSTYKIMENYRMKKDNKKKECLIWINWSQDHFHTSVRLNYENVMGMCLNLKETCQMSSTKPILACVRHTVGLGFLQSCVLGVYLGTTTYLITPTDYGLHPTTFYQALSRYQVENAFMTSKMLAFALKSINLQKCNLNSLKNLMVGWEERPDVSIINGFKEKLATSNISNTAISNVYDHPLNPLITTRSFLSFEPLTLWLDPFALSQGYISLVNPNDSPNAISVVDSGIVSVNTQLAIVNPETTELCKTGEFGEIWVCSESTVAGYAGKDDNEANRELFRGKIKDWNKDLRYLRTGDFGFLHTVKKNVGKSKENIELQLLFNLGKIDETFEYCGLQFFAFDIEKLVEEFAGIIRACIFKSGLYVVLVVETNTKRSLSSITPLIVLKILNKFKFVIDIITFVGVGDLPISRLGAVQRFLIAKKWMGAGLKTRDSFGINFGENSSIKTLKLIDWVEEKLSKS